MEKRILHVEDVTGEDYEFILDLPLETWKDISKLYEISKNLLLSNKNENDIITIEVLTLN